MRTIFYNGAVYAGTMPLVSSFVVEENRFLFAGEKKLAMSYYREGDRMVDLHGNFVCAGFNDSHMHLLNFGRALCNPRLDQHTGSLGDMLQCLREFDRENPGTGWIVGRGWNQDYFSDASRMPNRWDLDQVSKDRPVCAVRACGHALAVNSFALNLLQLSGHIKQPAGGEIVLEAGEPNGIFLDSAMDLIYDAFSTPGKDEIKNMIRSACRTLNSYGITSCHSDDYPVFSQLPWQAVNEAYRELEADGELTVRVYEQCNFSHLEDLKGFVEAGCQTGSGSDFFRIGPLKMLGDGALGPRTAFLTEPYADQPDNYGIPVFSQQQFDEMIGYAHAHGMQVAVHAIGDACLDRVLLALDKAQEYCQREDPRHGIVHCQITRQDQLEKIAHRKLHVYAQSIFLDYDIGIVEARVGNERASSSYSWKALMNRGVTVSNGSDCPVELPFALGGIQCAVTRKNLSGTQGPYLPGEAFTLEEALCSYTAAGAWASFEEGKKGRIEPGMLADFVILGANPFEISLDRISQIPVLETWVDGNRVYSEENGK